MDEYFKEGYEADNDVICPYIKPSREYEEWAAGALEAEENYIWNDEEEE